MELLVRETHSITEVYSTATSGVYQCDRERCWYVDFGGKIARFDYRNFLKLRKAAERFDIEQRLLNPAKEADLEIVFICACNHCYVLTIPETIALKELIDGTFVMLELNRIIHDRLAIKL